MGCIKTTKASVENCFTARVAAMSPAQREHLACMLNLDSADKRILAAIIPKPGRELNIESVRQFLRDRLPEPMTPSRLVVLSELPRNQNGKVDRFALLAAVPEKGKRINLNRNATPRDRHSGKSSDENTSPNDEIKQQLATIWCEILDVEDVGLDDNFFRLGGHSLLAIQLFSRIEEVFGLKLPLGVLFQNGTINQLHPLLKRACKEIPLASVLTLQGKGRARPLFLMPSFSGEIPIPLAQALIEQFGDKIPLLGIQLQLDTTHLQRFSDFREMASDIVHAMREHQPDGPYAVTGHSYGGTMAYEVARQLQSRGEEVDLLAIIDTRPYQIETRVGIKACGLGLWHSCLNFPSWLREEYTLYSYKRVFYRILRKGRRIMKFLWFAEGPQLEIEDVFGPENDPTGPSELKRFTFAAARDYVPESYPAKMTLLRAETRPLIEICTRDFGWSQLVEDAEIRDVPGDHVTICRPPHVTELARELQQLLDQRKGD